MENLELIHEIIRDPLTDKLFHKYVTDAKARRVFEVSVRLVELAVVATPLIMIAAKGLRDLANSKAVRKSKLRRLVPV